MVQNLKADPDRGEPIALPLVPTRELCVQVTEELQPLAEARGLRILAEYMEPLERFSHYRIEDTIIFFGSARILPPAKAEEELAAGWRQVTNGSRCLRSS